MLHFAHDPVRSLQFFVRDIFPQLLGYADAGLFEPLRDHNAFPTQAEMDDTAVVFIPLALQKAAAVQAIHAARHQRLGDPARGSDVGRRVLLRRMPAEEQQHHGLVRGQSAVARSAAHAAAVQFLQSERIHEKCLFPQVHPYSLPIVHLLTLS